MSHHSRSAHRSIVAGFHNAQTQGEQDSVGWVTPEVGREVRDRPDLIHIVHPEEVADFIAFLMSEEAGLLTGNVLHLR